MSENRAQGARSAEADSAAAVAARKPGRPRVLVVGFSVFQRHGINPRLVEAGEAAGIDIEIVALGGHTIFSVSHFITRILELYSPDAVILDLTTSATRGYIGEEQWLLHFDNIIRTIRGAGRRVGIVHFLRKDVDYLNDDMVRWCDAYCAAHDVETLNIAREMQTTLSRERIDKLIHDVVHPFPLGDGYYVERLIPMCQRLLSHPAPEPFAHSSQFLAFAVPELAGREPDSIIDRHGPRIGLTHLAAGETLRLALPAGFVPRIIWTVYGPRSGRMQVRLQNGTEVALQGYDANCYYERLAMEYLPFSQESEFEVTQLPDLPQEKLLKGTPDLGPRLGKLGYVLATRLPR